MELAKVMCFYFLMAVNDIKMSEKDMLGFAKII